MPNKKSKSKSKNQRRIAAAEKSLKKVHLVPALTKRARKAKSPQVSRIHPWCAALLTESIPSCELPAFGQAGPYCTRKFNSRYTAYAGAAVESSFVCNPYLLFSDNLYWERVSNNSATWQYCPTAVASSTATPSGALPSSTTNYYAPITFTSQFPTTQTIGYAGWVRPRYVKYKITYTGTELNKGGICYFMHNPSANALLCADDATASTGPAFVSAYTSNTIMNSDLPNISSHHLGDTLELTWFPRSYDFHQVESIVPQATAAVTGLYLENQAMLKYLPNDHAGSNTVESCPDGFVSGFKIIPAAGTAATVLPYNIEIEAVIDLDLKYITGANAGTPVALPDKRPIAHPVHEAQIKNALNYVHMNRQHTRNTSHANSSAVTKTVTSSLLSAAAGAAEQFGAEAASRVIAAF